MAIGTSVKVGFDGEAVKRGFGGIKGMFGGIARSFGKGAAMMGGAAAGKTLLDLGIKLAMGAKDLADYAGDMEDISTQTGIATSEVIKMNRALELAGANIDAGRMFSTLSDNIYDATHGGEELQNVFSSLGLNAYSLSKMKPMEQFMEIGRVLSNYTGDMGELNNITEKMFGAKMGMQLIRLFRNSDAFSQMGADVAQFADEIQANQGALGRFSDQLSRLPYLWRQFNLQRFAALEQVVGTDWLEDVFDWANDFLSVEKMLGVINSVKSVMEDLFQGGDFFANLKEKFMQLAAEIGAAIGDSLKTSFSVPGMLKNLIGINSGGRKETAMLEEMRQTNIYLSSIERTNGTYA